MNHPKSLLPEALLGSNDAGIKYSVRPATFKGSFCCQIDLGATAGSIMGVVLLSGRRLVFFLRIGLGLEAGDVDDEAFVGAFADYAPGVLGNDLEDQPPAVNLHQL